MKDQFFERFGFIFIITVFLIGGSGVVASIPDGVHVKFGVENQPTLQDRDSVQATTTQQESSTSPLRVENLSAPNRIQTGDAFSVSATIVNKYPNWTVQRVSYRIGGTVIDAQWVQVPNRSSKTVTFNISSEDTAGLPTGTYPTGVFIFDHNRTSTLTLLPVTEITIQPTETASARQQTTTSRGSRAINSSDSNSFTILMMQSPSTVYQGDVIRVHAIVSNPTDGSATQDVTLRLNGTVISRETITLGTDEQVELLVTIETDNLRPRPYTLSIFTQDFGSVAVVIVRDPSNQTAMQYPN
jgi:hypothetical protein